MDEFGEVNRWVPLFFVVFILTVGALPAPISPLHSSSYFSLPAWPSLDRPAPIVSTHSSFNLFAPITPCCQDPTPQVIPTAYFHIPLLSM
jgi:hypothetical protein